MEERAIANDRSLFVYNIAAWLLAEIEKWIEDFDIECQEKTGIVQGDYGDFGDAAAQRWYANLSSPIYATYRLIHHLDLTKPTRELTTTLIRQIDPLVRYRVLESKDFYERCDGEVRIEDIDRFYAWIMTPNGNEPRGLEWAIAMIRRAVGWLSESEVASIPFKLWDQREINTKHQTLPVVPSNDPDKAPSPESREQKQEELRSRVIKRRRQQARDAELAVTASASRTVTTMRELTATTRPEKEAELHSRMQDIEKRSQKAMRQLSVKESTTFYFHSAAPKILAVGERSLPDDLLPDFKISGQVTILPNYGRKGKGQRGRVKVSLHSSDHELFLDEIKGAFLKLGWNVAAGSETTAH